MKRGGKLGTPLQNGSFQIYSLILQRGNGAKGKPDRTKDQNGFDMRNLLFGVVAARRRKGGGTLDNPFFLVEAKSP